MMDMSQNNLLIVDLENLETDGLREKFNTIKSWIRPGNGKAKMLINCNKLKLTNSLIDFFIEFYSKWEDDIAAIAISGVGSSVRRVILDSTGIPFFYAEDKEEGIELLNDLDEDV